jgi:hypothetical protein
LLDCATDDDASDPAVMAARYFDDPMPLDRVWLAYEPVLVAAWAEEYAGSRPSYWWRLSAPGAPDAHRAILGGSGRRAKGQVRAVPANDISAQRAFVHQVFGLAA